MLTNPVTLWYIYCNKTNRSRFDFIGGIFVDNSFDKLNEQFADKARGGFKYWFFVVLSFVCAVIAIGFGIFALLPGNNKYLSLLTLLFGLFGWQAVTKAKGTQSYNTLLKIALIINFVALAFAVVVLYIVLPNSGKKK